MGKQADIESWDESQWWIQTVDWSTTDKAFLKQQGGVGLERRVALLEEDAFKGTDQWSQLMRAILSLPEASFQRMLKSFEL